MFKKNKNHRRLGKMAVLALTGVMIVSGGITKAFAGTNVSMDNKKDITQNNKNLSVVVKEKSLSVIDMLNGQEKEVDRDGEFKSPRISEQGINVAYIKDKSLYIGENLLENKKTVVKVNDEPISYAWKDKNTLIYSLYKGGVYEFNLKDKVTKVYIDSQDRYKNMVLGKDGKVYGEKYYDYVKDGQQYSAPKGLISYDPINKKEEVIIEPRSFNEEKNDLGLVPVVSKISSDGRYIYIWMKSRSGSMNADGVGIGVYDIDTKKLTTFDNKDALVLAYNDNIAINPIDNSTVVLNNGGLRDMNRNKTLVMANVIKGTWEEILPKNMISTSGVYGDVIKGITTMTPSFSPDGKKVIYSGAIAMESGIQWEKAVHNIYSVDLENKKVEQITVSSGFDFAPTYIDNGEAIAFLRKASDKVFELWKIEGVKEKCLVKDIKIDDNSFYYGHYNLDGVMDFYIGE